MPVDKLQALIDARQGTVEELARTIGCDRVTLYRWASGKTLPDWNSMQNLYLFSNGYVTPNDFLPKATIRIVNRRQRLAYEARLSRKTAR